MSTLFTKLDHTYYVESINNQETEFISLGDYIFLKPSPNIMPYFLLPDIFRLVI